jgi:DNA-binding response OmpR family regulator
MRVLLVEDDEMLGSATAATLRKNGHVVDWARTGADALAANHAADFDVILLDLGLPDMRGEDCLPKLRTKRTPTPVIVLTARGQVEDRIGMLDLGADDYLVKPFDFNELGARLRAVTRRAFATANGDNNNLKHGPLELFAASRSARWNGKSVTLTAKEYGVLEVLMMRRHRIVSRKELEEALYGWGDEVESNAIEVYVYYLRQKLAPAVIVTIRRMGYQIGNEEMLFEAAKAQTATAR